MADVTWQWFMHWRRWWRLVPRWGEWPGDVRQFRYPGGESKPTIIVVFKWYAWSVIELRLLPSRNDVTRWNRLATPQDMARQRQHDDRLRRFYRDMAARARRLDD